MSNKHKSAAVTLISPDSTCHSEKQDLPLMGNCIQEGQRGEDDAQSPPGERPNKAVINAKWVSQYLFHRLRPTLFQIPSSPFCDGNMQGF